jgi:hypothetical protein
MLALHNIGRLFSQFAYDTTEPREFRLVLPDPSHINT